MDHRADAHVEQRGHRTHRGDVEHRSHTGAHVIVADVQGRDTGDRLRLHVRVRKHGALGVTGGSRGVHDHRDRVLRHVDRRQIGGVLCKKVLVVERVGDVGRADDDQVLDAIGALADRIRQRRQQRLGDDNLRTAVGHEESDLGRRHPDVDRHRDRTDEVGAEDRLDILTAVQHQDQHTVAETHTASVQRCSERDRAVVEFLPRGVLTLETQRHVVRLHRRVPPHVGVPVVPARPEWLFYQVV